MKSDFNLVIGILCFALVCLDYIIMGLTGLTPILSFLAGANIMYAMGDRYAKCVKGEQDE